MKIWLVTTGSSDVQLKSDDHWDDWYRKIKQNCYRLPFKAKPVDDEDLDTYYRLAPRVLGMAYQAFPEGVWSSLEFPLLKEFICNLQGENIDKIILLLTDQTPIFDETRQDDIKCPYWQDTCTLQPIFKRYFEEQFPDTELIPLLLSPKPDKPGLDDWNEVLTLVRDTLNSDEFAAKILNPETVYVSHQAGTPAISSAVQFISLARFRNNVQFLVSNEYDRQTRPIPRSTYLRGIQIQEAKALLEQHNYAGVRSVLGLTQITPSTPQEKLIKILLDAGEQWNFARFYKFKDKIIKAGIIEETSFPWWRLGYESAYLALIRLDQRNTVEALFHSFRAMEGMISKWAEQYYQPHILRKGDKDYKSQYGPQIKHSICSVLPNYFDALSEPNQKRFSQYGTIGFYGDPLYELFRQARSEWRGHPHIEVVWKTAKAERNTLFHRIEGLQPEDVLKAWDLEVSDDWEENTEKLEARLRGCLNFIAEKDLSKQFESLEAASLMAKAHRALREAIAQL